MPTPVVLIPGDGIGPEVTAATRQVVQAAGADIDWIEAAAGLGAAGLGAAGAGAGWPKALDARAAASTIGKAPAAMRKALIGPTP